jgi:hypothetical protein
MTPSAEELRERERDIEAQRKKLERQRARRAQTIEELRKRQQRDLVRLKAKRERERELEHAIKEAQREDLWKRRACIDGCTTWLGLQLVIVTVGAKTAWEAMVNAADRTSHADDCGDKSSQAELYSCFINRTASGCPGGCASCNPANPPGHSTHEGVCDATFAAITKWDEGESLPPFAWGLDVGDGDGFVAGAKQLGFEVVRPYGNEPWHVNLTADPTAALKETKAI